MFAVNGLGLGNSTRCLAIIQRLVARGFRVSVATSGNGLSFFRDKKEIANVYELEAVAYAKTAEGRLSAWRTVANLLIRAPAFVRNGIRLVGLIRGLRTDLLVYDSQYNFFPRLLTDTRIVAINNADMILRSFFRFRRKPIGIFPQFFLIEISDFLIHQVLPHRVLSPWIATRSSLRKSSASRFLRLHRTHPIGLIIRDEIADLAPIGGVPSSRNVTAKKPRRVVIMLSGSSFDTKIDPASWRRDLEYDVLGRAGTDTANVRFHGRVRDTSTQLARADILIVNGGYSAVSEALALRKPTLVIPIEKHAEQYINARLIETFGVGRPSGEATVQQDLDELVETFEHRSAAIQNLQIPVEGAEDAADFIASWMSEKRND